MDEPRFEGDSPNPSHPPVRRRTAAWIWWLLMLALGPAPILALATAPADPRPEHAGVLLGAACALAAVGWIVPRAALSDARRRGGQPPNAVASSATLTAMTLGFAGAFGASAALWITRSPLLLAPWLADALLLVRWYPTTARWRRLEGRSRMIRGG